MQDLSDKFLSTLKNLQFGKLCVDLSNNYLTEIDNFIECKSLNLSRNKIKELKNISENIEELYIQNNELTSITFLPKKLKELSLSHNPINIIDFDLSKLKYLEFIDLSNTDLHALPILPNGVQEVDICNTKITILPKYLITSNVRIFRHNLNVNILHKDVQDWLETITEFSF